MKARIHAGLSLGRAPLRPGKSLTLTRAKQALFGAFHQAFVKNMLSLIFSEPRLNRRSSKKLPPGKKLNDFVQAGFMCADVGHAVHW